MVVAGLDGLDARDNARVRAALDRGTTVILQADGPVPRSLHDLWPDAPSRVISGATPRTLTLGVHRWTVREWLAPAAGPPHQTTLASLDGDPPVPAIVARAVGAGRVVLVAALDAWRWRLDDSASFEPAWQALVGSLALRGPGAAPAAWRVPAPLGDEVHVATGWSRGALTDDDVAVSSAALTVVGGDDEPRLAALVGSRDGVRRAAWRTVASPDWLEVSLLPSADVGAAGPSVIQVGPRSRLPASWDDVVRVIVGSGGMVVTLEDLPAALDRRTRLDAGRPVRWWLTRQWWYAALVIVLLGGEWWMRRLLREP
jgi:hypothetical protein